MLKEKEFKTIYTNNYNMLYQLGLNIVRDQDVAHDVIQEVFTKLWKKRDKLLISVPLEVYLRKAVVNTSINHHKRNSKFIPIDQQTDLPYLEIDDEKYSDFKKALEEGIATLTPKCKTIFILSRIEGLDNQEIADYLDISKKTVENQLSLALKRLKEYFETRRSKHPDQFKMFMLLFF